MTTTFAARWQDRLHDGFPLLVAMQLQVVGDAGHWQLQAPFSPNRNDHGTAFGGSLATLAIITGWMAASLLADPDCEVVIQSAHHDYTAPLTGDLVATALPVPTQAASQFARAVARQRPARLEVRVRVQGVDGAVVGEFVGRYVALPVQPI